MMYKSLILGVLFGIGIFAVKAGAGLCYAMIHQPGFRGKCTVILLFTITYGALFGLVSLTLHYIDPVEHLPAILRFLKSGMIVHIVMAVLMMIWGLFLLRQSHDFSGSSRGWLLLALPCPVCGVVILFSTGFFVSFFPDYFMWVGPSLFIVFVMISLATMGVLHFFERHTLRSPETFLGGAMLLLAGYFILSVTVMPQFADLDKVYRMAGYQSGKASLDRLNVFLTAFISSAFFVTGFTYKLKIIRRRMR